MSERRNFLKSLMAGTIAGLPAVKSIEVLQVKPEDTLILNVDSHISDETSARLKAAVERELGGQKCLVLGKNLELKVLRKG